jgi:hypothetical protein
LKNDPQFEIILKCPPPCDVVWAVVLIVTSEPIWTTVDGTSLAHAVLGDMYAGRVPNASRAYASEIGRRVM